MMMGGRAAGIRKRSQERRRSHHSNGDWNDRSRDQKLRHYPAGRNCVAAGRMVLRLFLDALGNALKRRQIAVERVTVTVSGLTGSGKSRITHEIEVALKAVGVSVAWTDPADKREADAEAHSEQSGGWQPELPEVTLQEMNVPRRPREGYQMATGQRHAPIFETFKGLQFYAKDSDGQWHYVNHAGTWQACPPPVS